MGCNILLLQILKIIHIYVSNVSLNELIRIFETYVHRHRTAHCAQYVHTVPLNLYLFHYLFISQVGTISYDP